MFYVINKKDDMCTLLHAETMQVHGVSVEHCRNIANSEGVVGVDFTGKSPKFESLRGVLPKSLSTASSLMHFMCLLEYRIRKGLPSTAHFIEKSVSKLPFDLNAYFTSGRPCSIVHMYRGVAGFEMQRLEMLAPDVSRFLQTVKSNDVKVFCLKLRASEITSSSYVDILNCRIVQWGEDKSARTIFLTIY